MELSGTVSNWQLNGTSRKYIVATLPFSTAREIFRPDLYKADNGEGEQRSIFPTHARNLKKDMLADAYTPTAVAVGMNDKVAATLVEESDGKVAKFTVDDKTGHLPLIDGGHRFDALDNLVKEGKKEALEVPITALIYLDNRNKENFLNAQKGRPVDKAHIMSLQVGAELTDPKVGKYLRTAFDIAKILNTEPTSPFCRFIKFDSRSIAPLPISTLSAKGASDLGTSLVGLAKIVHKAGKDATWGASAVIDAFQAVKAKAPELLELGRVLTPPPDGSRGSATMWIGLGNLLAYRLTLPDDGSVVTDSLVEAAKQVCDHTVRGNFSGPKKRELLGEIAFTFFATVKNVPFYKDEIPQELVDLLSYSTFDIKKPKKVKKIKAIGPKKKPGRKPKAKAEVPGITQIPKNHVNIESLIPQTKVEETKPDGSVVEDSIAPWEQQPVEEEVQA
jgi:hypothetical protein